MSISRKFLASFVSALLSVAVLQAQPFVHPGIFHSRNDLLRMKEAVAEKREPIYSGYRLFIQNPASAYTYKMQGPLKMVARNPTVGQGNYDNDANAAHQNAIMWAITGQKAYADKAIEIINAWSSALSSITGKDAVLMAGLGPFKMVNAAEIIRYTDAGWQENDIRQAERHFKLVVYPVIKNFAPFANGNWDAAAIKTVMGIGVFCNDRAIFEDALHYYTNGAGNGAIRHYIINENGQIQESGRDQAHTQLGIGMLAECCQIAWNQGLDLYAYDDNRLLKGFEYVAKFNLGEEVPFSETLDRTGKYHHLKIARHDRGPLRAVYEQVYNHYVNLVGLQAPYIQKAAEKIRPEGPGRPGADHPGYGTLFFSRTPGQQSAFSASAPAAPAAPVALADPSSVMLNWVSVIGATSYSLERSESEEGPYKVLAAKIAGTTYADKDVRSGSVYYYRLKASNMAGTSSESRSTAISAGLPVGWEQFDVGEVTEPGSTLFNGKEFILHGSGKGIDSLKDSFHFTGIQAKRRAEIIIRYVPQLSSQFTSFGITIREDKSPGAAHVSLSFVPGKTSEIEAPDWHVRFTERKSGGMTKNISTLNKLPESAVTYGRMTGNYWLRVVRNGKKILAYASADGKQWKALGKTRIVFKNGYSGLFAGSGMPNGTVVKLDQVKLED